MKWNQSIKIGLVVQDGRRMIRKLVELSLLVSLVLTIVACAPAANPPKDLLPPSPSPSPS